MAKLSNTQIFGWLQVIGGYITGRLKSITGQSWNIINLGSVTTTLTMDCELASEFTATLPVSGTTTINLTNLPTELNSWPILHLITQSTVDQPSWNGIDEAGIILDINTAYTIGFQPVFQTSAWKVVAKIMHSEADA